MNPIDKAGSAPGRRVIAPGHEEWPAKFHEPGPIEPPVRLHVVGRRLTLGRETVAIVGSRRPTAAGVEAAESLARGLAQAGFAIVSGLAVGIDAVAHRAALDAGGYTVAVLGCGLNHLYPHSNADLRARIEQDGTVITEYDDDEGPDAWRFPKRNRIIAALSEGVIFVEGGPRSGGLITARLAVDANRHVFAVPGSIRNPMAIGPNELIRTSQASLVTDVKHVCDELAPGLVWNDAGDTLDGDHYDLSEHDLRVLYFLDDIASAPDAICSALALSPGRVCFSLARLEVTGLAQRIRGGYVVTSTGQRVRAARRSKKAEAPTP